jgi:hypothetical protein
LCKPYLSYASYLIPRRSRGTATVRLLARIARLRRATRRRSVTTLLRPARRATRRRSVAALLLLTIALLRRATVAALLGRRTAVATLLRRATKAARVALLVLSVVRRIDRTENELEDPKIGGEVDRRVGTSHLGGLVLEVGSAVFTPC